MSIGIIQLASQPWRKKKSLVEYTFREIRGQKGMRFEISCSLVELNARQVFGLIFI